MPPAKPMLDEIELRLVQKIDTEGEQVQAQHGVPALEGDFLQGLGRRATRVTLNGVMTGAEAAEDLKTLREKFRDAEPVSFVADIATATDVGRVLIEEMGVRELAGKPERFEYALTLREFVPPPPPVTQQPPPIPPQPTPTIDVATLVVEVEVEGEPDFDFGTVRVTLDGTKDDGGPLSMLLTNHTDGVWVEEGLPPGSYTVSAVVEGPVAMAGEAQAVVRPRETTQVKIILRPGVVIAKAFVVHFRFDSAFVEPCLRQVLRRVFDYAQDHPDEKLVIVGHTDLVGDDPYNQKLSERRGRSVYAFLTSGTSDAHRDAAINEWDDLRKNPVLTPLNDRWDRREYQYILQDLGYYRGRIDEPYADDPEPPRFSNADSAIRGFQSDHALPVTGVVNGATWRALVTEYLALDALAVPDSQFLPNANEAGCNGGLLKWLGFGEKDPVKNIKEAWRPNRRTEMLFVRAGKLPNAVAKPVTFDLPAPGVVGTTWCLDVGAPAAPPSFLARGQSQPGKWLVVPAEPGKVTVGGVIKFADETRAANMKYVLIAPDGEFLRKRDDGTADPVAERPKGPMRGRGVPGRTDAEGNFSHPAQTPVGVYILQLPDLVNPSVARESNGPPENAVGNIVCLRLTPGAGTPGGSSLVGGAGPASIGATIHPTPPPAAPVNPLIQMTTTTVVLKKSYTNPARVPVTLKTSARFNRRGTLTRSSDAIRFFTAPQGGTEILFAGGDNVFPGGRLSDPAGVQLFAQARTKSGSANDFQLTLTLDPPASPGAQPVGAALTVTMTALALTLNLHQSPAPGVLTPPTLPQPPDPPPAPGTAIDKWFGGRVVNVQFGSSQERVMMSVAVEPTDFAGELTLRQVKVAGTTVGALDDAKLTLFDNTEQTPGESALANPFDFPASSVGLTGRKFGVQGKEPSVTLRDRGFQLGVKGVENDGDRVAFTVGVGAVIFTPADFVLVKKPHTNPKRMEITLFTTAPFNRKGKLERSRDEIRFFKEDGTEILFNNTDNVFEGAALTNGVKIVAEGRVSSPTANEADRVRLTLTLDAGASPLAGTPATARLVSVELTLDVAATRVPPAAAALLTEAQKITPGRFVQVNSPDFRHERAKLIVRPPKPVFPVGKIVLAPLDASKVQLFAEETPQNNQTASNLPLEFDDFLIPAAGREFFIEGRGISLLARDAGFTLKLKGQTDEADRINVTVVQIEVVDQPNNAVAAATFVRMGLWDRAFGFPATAVNTPFNDPVEANNFAGADSRKFHLRVRDAASRNAGHVNVDWRTLNRANNDLDNPANNFISLVETPANSGVFISRGLILVTDNNDRDLRTHHGLPATIPQTPPAAPDNLRARGESNHRVRRASMFNDMIVEYRPAAQSTLPVRLPVFQRAPESRRRFPVQIFVLRDAPGPASATAVSTAPGDPIWATDLRVMRECYERIGIAVDTVVAPTAIRTDIVTDGTDSALLIDPPAGILNATNISTADETLLGTTFPALPDTMRLFFVRNLASGNGGEAWSDAITTTPASLPRRATVFTIQTTGPFAAAHELGHILSNKQVPTSACDPTVGVRGHYCAPAPATRLLNDQNLMKVQFLGGEGVAGAKRIWDGADADGVNYFTAMRRSHYTRNF
jgi:hypothetical protein